MSKVCPHCQQEVEQEDRPFCPHCGYAFDIDVRLAMEMQKFLKEQPQQAKKTTKQVNQIYPPISNRNNNDSYDYSRLHRKESTATTGIVIAIAIICIIITISVFLLLH